MGIIGNGTDIDDWYSFALQWGVDEVDWVFRAVSNEQFYIEHPVLNKLSVF